MQITGDHDDEYLIMSMISRHVTVLLAKQVQALKYTKILNYELLFQLIFLIKLLLPILYCN